MKLVKHLRVWQWSSEDTGLVVYILVNYSPDYNSNESGTNCELSGARDEEIHFALKTKSANHKPFLTKIYSISAREQGRPSRLRSVMKCEVYWSSVGIHDNPKLMLVCGLDWFFTEQRRSNIFHQYLTLASEIKEFEEKYWEKIDRRHGSRAGQRKTWNISMSPRLLIINT